MGLTVVGVGANVGGCALVPPLPTFADPTRADAAAWVQMRPDGRVRFLLPRAEMGQGIDTGLSRVVAEELGVPLDRIDCAAQDTAAMAPCRITVGSQSVEDYAAPVARAAAGLREALAVRAATLLGVRPGALEPTAAGFASPDGRTVAHARLVDPPGVLAPSADDDSPRLLSERPAAALRVLGRPGPSMDLERLVRGRELYSRDVRMPGMLFGAVARPPQIGATLTGFDRAAAERIEGVVAVVEHDDGVGVVARTPGRAERAIEALAARWRPLDARELAAVERGVDVERDARAGLLDHALVDEGSIAEGRRDATADLRMRFDSPMVAHAALEPRCGVASWTGESDGGHACEIHTGSQDPWLVRAAAAHALGIDDARIVVRNHRIGGAFGGRALCQASVEAAWLSRAVGRPVKVQWRREDEFRHNYAGPPYSSSIEAGLDASGRIAYWFHRAVGAPILTSSTLVPPWLHWAANLVADSGTQRGMAGPYRYSNHKVRFADVRLPMHTGPWRGLGAAPNAFAVESAMDELAGAAGIDPVTFRLNHLDEPRLANCLERLRELVPDIDGAGVAAAAYKGVTFVAVAARAVVRDDRPVVTEMYCVHDCGRMLAPDRVRAQIEGCMAWGVGMALHEELNLEDGIAATVDLDRYVLARQRDVPDVTIEMVESDVSPSGAGEAAFVPTAAAIANAVHRATGRRHRRLPIRSV